MDGHVDLRAEDDVIVIEDDTSFPPPSGDALGDEVAPQRAFIAFFCLKGEVPYIHPSPIEDIRLSDVSSQNEICKVNSVKMSSQLQTEVVQRNASFMTKPIVITPFNVELEFSAYKGKISEEIVENLISNTIWVICVELQNGLPVMFLHSPEADQWPQCQLIMHSEVKHELTLCSIHVPKMVLDSYSDLIEALTRLFLLPWASALQGFSGSDVMHSLGISTDQVPASSSQDVNLSHVCVECGDSFQYEDQLDKHIMWHMEDMYPCEICAEIFHKLDELEAHTKQHSSVDFYPCEFCSKIYCNLLSLNEHYRTHIEFPCNVCGVQYSSLYGLRNHKKTHTSPVNTEMNAHMSSMNADMSTTTEQRESNSQSLVLKHLEMQNKLQTTRQYKCHFCPRAFKFPQFLRFHLSKKHGVDEDNVTIDCEENMMIHSEPLKIVNLFGGGRKNVLNRPSMFEKQIPEAMTPNRHQCQFCSMSYCNTAGLREHIRCRHLDQIAGRPVDDFIKNKKNPVNYVAELKRKVNCFICNKLVRKGQGMRNHMKTHVNESKRHNGHNSTVENDESLLSIVGLSMDYNCGICAAVFKEYSDLQTHMKIHES